MADEFEVLQHREERTENRNNEEREILSQNENSLIKILLILPGAALVGGLSQTDVLIDLASLFSFLIFLSTMSLSLLIALLAAYWQHQYTALDIKGRSETDEREQSRRFKLSKRYLMAVRAAIRVSLFLITVGFIQLIIFTWFVAPDGQINTDGDQIETAIVL